MFGGYNNGGLTTHFIIAQVRKLTNSFVGPVNHLWMYSLVLNYWSWVKGNDFDKNGYSTGRYLESSSNIPSARQQHSFTALSSANGFLMFGGQGDIGTLIPYYDSHNEFRVNE